ncbi:ribosome recycling factor [Violaceomyces palustris]|uniref:Ribosome recycling factor n=1 Tax=Violaceomyces palustris TaxID=1673888 RepID=A0ACD0P3K6_9BASI|nr:ribosome recycling factor [Violaceomyces palustris]
MDAFMQSMSRAVERCKTTVSNMVGSLGRADPALLDSVKVEYPGGGGSGKVQHPLREFATVGVRDGSLLVTCFDVDMVKHVERSIYAANLGLTPQVQAGDDETVLRVPVPRPTSETRAQLVKDCTKICENARVSIRAARHTVQKQLKNDENRKIVSKNEAAKEMKKIEEETKKKTAEVDALFEQTKKKLQ